MSHRRVGLDREEASVLNGPLEPLFFTLQMNFWVPEVNLLRKSLCWSDVYQSDGDRWVRNNTTVEDVSKPGSKGYGWRQGARLCPKPTGFQILQRLGLHERDPPTSKGRTWKGRRATTKMELPPSSGQWFPQTGGWHGVLVDHSHDCEAAGWLTYTLNLAS